MKRQGTVKNLIGYAILPYLEDKKLTCYSFVDTGKRLLGLRQMALLLPEKVMPPKSHGGDAKALSWMLGHAGGYITGEGQWAWGIHCFYNKWKQALSV